MWDKHLELYLKYDNEDDFVEAYSESIPDKEIDMTNGLDAEQALSEIMAHEIDKRILGGLVWFGWVETKY